MGNLEKMLRGYHWQEYGGWRKMSQERTWGLWPKWQTCQCHSLNRKQKVDYTAWRLMVISIWTYWILNTLGMSSWSDLPVEWYKIKYLGPIVSEGVNTILQPDDFDFKKQEVQTPAGHWWWNCLLLTSFPRLSCGNYVLLQILNSFKKINMPFELWYERWLWH